MCSYVQDLVKLVDTFTSNLLPASTTTPTLTLDDPIASLMRTLSPGSSLSASPAAGSPIHSQSHQTSPALPIAAQFARSQQGSLFDDPTSPIAFSSTGLPSDARLDAYQKLTNGRPGAGSSTSINAPVAAGLGLGGGSVRPGMTSRASLPGPAPPRRQGSFTGSVRNSSAHSTIGAGVDLPEELKKVLETIANGILPGHVKLAAALRRRYENQYPLVRSLADVFTAHVGSFVSICGWWYRRSALWHWLARLCTRTRRGYRRDMTPNTDLSVKLITSPRFYANTQPTCSTSNEPSKPSTPPSSPINPHPNASLTLATERRRSWSSAKPSGVWTNSLPAGPRLDWPSRCPSRSSVS